jgi:hypothetical protein
MKDSFKRKEKSSERNRSQWHFVTTNPRCTGLQFNQDLRSNKLASNRLNHDLAKSRSSIRPICVCVCVCI